MDGISRLATWSRRRREVREHLGLMSRSILLAPLAVPCFWVAKARLVITDVGAGKHVVSDAAAQYPVPRAWTYELVAGEHHHRTPTPPPSGDTPPDPQRHPPLST